MSSLRLISACVGSFTAVTLQAVAATFANDPAGSPRLHLHINRDSGDISFAPEAWPADALAVLSRALKTADLSCSNFLPHRGDWARLLSLQGLEELTIRLRLAAGELL